jgi:hypothetical protein
MTERQEAYRVRSDTQCAKTSQFAVSSVPVFVLERAQEQPDFQQGYEEGQAQYQQWHQHDTGIDANTLLFLVRNGWASGTHSDLWQTGYIVGWLFALFTQLSNK